MKTKAKAKPKVKPKVKPFWWFQGKSVRELVSQLEEYGPDTVRLEVHLDGDKMTFQVKPTGDAGKNGSDPPPINDSFICPPIC